jgi:hypothetical protein
LAAVGQDGRVIKDPSEVVRLLGAGEA